MGAIGRVYRWWLFASACVAVTCAMGCSKQEQRNQRQTPYVIAYPRNWGTFASAGSEQLTGFISDLLYEAGQEGNISIRLVVDDVEAFPLLLRTGKADAILTSMPVDTITRRLYDFSAPIFVGGTVIVVAASSPLKSVDDVDNAEIAFLRSGPTDITVGTKVSWVLRPYGSQALAIDDVIMGKVDGLLLNFMDAIHLNKSLYRSRLRILLPPVMKKSVRLATLPGKNSEILDIMNLQVKKLVLKSEYVELLKYWGIDHPLPSEEQKNFIK